LADERVEQMSRGRFQVLLALLRLTHAAAAPSRRHHGHSGHHGKKQPKVTHNSKIAALRETLCPGAKVDPGRFALLGTELPTRKVTSKGYAEIWDRFPYASLKFTVPRPAVGHHALVNGVCVTQPAAPRPGESRRYLAAFMGLPRSAFGGLRDRLVRECEQAADCATTTTGFAAHHKPDPVTTYGNATFALQPWGDTGHEYARGD
jgi:hypothetical protein